MAIYTSVGGRCKIICAEQRIEHFDGVPCPVWYVKAELLEKYLDGSGKVGKLLSDGQFIRASRFVADDGFVEIEAACKAVEISVPLAAD